MLLALVLAAQSFTYTLPAPLAQPAPSVARGQESRQGWLGVNLAIEEGADRPLSVSDVSGGSPAERADLQPGDRLIALDGRPIAGYEALIELLRERGPGSEVALTVRRALAVELDERGWGEDGGPRLGVHLAQQEGGDGGARWVVSRIEQGWPAARAGVQAGDRIVALAGSEPSDFDELQSLLAGVGAGEQLELSIERDLRVRLGERPGEADRFQGLAQPTPRRFEAVPGERERLQLRRPAAPERAGELERQLREEINGLNQELRALREELRTLRRELAALRER